MATANQTQKHWEEEINRANKARDQWATDFRIELGRQFFEGFQNPGLPAAEWITVNKIYTHLMAQLPTMYSVDPYFYVKLKKSFKIDPKAIVEMEQKGDIRQANLNYLKTELKLKVKARLGILDAHFEYGVIKSRRASDLEKHPQAGETIVDNDGDPILTEDGAEQVYPDEKPLNERYELLRVHPRDMLFSADAGPLEDDWPWLAQHFSMSKKKARKDPRFKNADIDKIQGRKPDPDGTERKKKKLTDFFRSVQGDETDENDIIDFYELYDLDDKAWGIIAMGAEKPLLKFKPTPPGIEGHPYSILRFVLRDDSPYPIPPVAPAIDPQKELSLSRSRRLTHLKRFNRKYEIDVNKLEDPDTEMAKLEVGEDGAMVRVRALGAVSPIKDAPLDQQNMLHDQQLANDLTEAFGSPGSSRGLADADSATEAGLLDKRLEVREGDRLSLVTEWLGEVARKLDMLVQFHIDRDEAVKITGPQGEFYQAVKQEDYEEIQGEFQYSVDVGATRPRLPDVERAQWIAFLSQVVVPLPHILTQPRVMKRMAEMFHIEDEAALEEFRKMGEAILQGQVPQPGQQGGGPSNNPVAAVLGAAGGPGGGNVNGGGAQ